MKPIQIPDDRDFMAQGGIPWWKTLHAKHFDTNEHVSTSDGGRWAAFFGSVDCGTRLHIPMVGKERDTFNRRSEKDAQAKRCRALRQPTNGVNTETDTE